MPRLLCRSLNFGCSVSDRALFFLRVVCSATTSLRRLAGRRGVSISFEPRRMSKPLCAFTWGNWSSSERTWELKPTSRAEIRLFSIRDTAKTALDPDRYSKSRRGATARPSVTCSHTYSSSSSSDSRRTTASGDAGSGGVGGVAPAPWKWSAHASRCASRHASKDRRRWSSMAAARPAPGSRATPSSPSQSRP